MGKRKSYKKKWGGDETAVAAAPAAANDVSVKGLLGKWQDNTSARIEEAKGQGLAKLAEHKAVLTGELGALQGQVANAKKELFSKLPGLSKNEPALAAPMPAPAPAPMPMPAPAAGGRRRRKTRRTRKVKKSKKGRKSMKRRHTKRRR